LIIEFESVFHIINANDPDNNPLPIPSPHIEQCLMTSTIYYHPHSGPQRCAL
jgi:hypothetical protein